MTRSQKSHFDISNAYIRQRQASWLKIKRLFYILLRSALGADTVIKSIFFP